MGIRCLNKLILQFAKDSVGTKKLSEFAKTKIAIDSEILIFKFRAREGDSKNSHIHGFINNICWFLRNGIMPVYVFDGRPVQSKWQNAIAKRKEVKESMEKEVDDLKDQFETLLEAIGSDAVDDEIVILDQEANDAFNKYTKLKNRLDGMKVTKEHKKECKYLLKVLGIPFINANDDAEALCVALHKNGLVDYVYTEDTDALVYAAAMHDTSITILRKGDFLNDTITTVNLDQVLTALELNSKSFVDMCIMSGCDFCSGIPMIGPIKSYSYMKECSNIEKFLELYGGNYAVPNSFDYKEARNQFSKEHMITDIKTIEMTKVDQEQFRKYMIEERDIDPKSVLDKINSAMKVYSTKVKTESKSKQLTIDSFFPSLTKRTSETKGSETKGSETKVSAGASETTDSTDT